MELSPGERIESRLLSKLIPLTSHKANVSMQNLLADDGERIHVEIVGQGPPVILLHEWAADHSLWHVIAGRLKDRFTLYYWDARGHAGHPALGSEPPTVQRMARDLRLLIDAFELQHPILVGHSMGALTIWEFVKQYGCDDIARLCLLDQSPRLLTGKDWQLGIYGDFSEVYSRDFSQRLRTDFPETVLQLIANGRNQRARRLYRENSKGFQRLREKLARMDPNPLITCWESLTAMDCRPILPQIEVPTLLIFGGNSNYYDPRTGEYLREAIPDARLHLYEGADHSPHLAQCDRFIHDLVTFLGE